MKVRINKKQMSKIADAIKQAELKTSGEIYCVVARKSGDYLWFMMVICAFLAILIPLIMAAFNYKASDNIGGWGSYENSHQLNMYIVLLIQTAIFTIGALIARLPSFTSIVPYFLKHYNVHNNAIEQFMANQMHDTRDRTGVLIFVSVKERIVEVVADRGIYQKVDKTVWGRAVQKIVDETRNGNITQGLIDGIEDVGGVLAQHFPPRVDDVNEIRDGVTII